MKSFEIFSAGKHTATNGDTIEFSAADLAAIASSYNTALHEAPIVVGHPKSNHPAYGWIKGVTVENGRLVAEPHQVDPAFSELVEKARFKKVSASFYRPTDPSNPTPGNFHLRHVGFLGAQPPALKGLKQVEFSDSGDMLTFADWNGMTVAGLFRGLRELLIGHFGQDEADRALPSDSIDQLTITAALDDDTDNLPPAYSERTENVTTQAELDRSLAELNARQAELDARDASFAERDRAIRASEFTAFIDPLIAEGRLLPAHKAGLVAFMENLHGSEPVSFGESSGAKTAPLDFLKGFLKGLPKAVDFSERAADEQLPEGALTRSLGSSTLHVRPERAELEQQALAYMDKHPGVTFTTAVRAVERAA